MPLIRQTLDEAAGRVTHEWSFAVTADRLWRGLTEPTALPQWLGTLREGTFNAGETVVVEHAENYPSTSHILECTPQHSLRMTWEFPDENPSELSLRMNSADPTTSTGSATPASELTLTHTGLAGLAPSYLTGWHTHLLYLEALLLGRPLDMGDFWATYESLGGS